MLSGQAVSELIPERTTGETRARQAVARALARGEIARGPCEVCGRKNAHAHHDDYLKALEVRWLCAKHHAELHSREPRVNPARILQARVEAGLSQSELAELVGCSTRTIQGWEAGRPIRPQPR